MIWMDDVEAIETWRADSCRGNECCISFDIPVNRPVSARYTSLWNSRVKISLECRSKLARLSKKFHPYDLVVVRVIRSSSN